MNNIEVIQELYETFRDKDYEAFRRICDPSIEWIQNEGFPNGSTNYGADAVIENVFKAFNNDWESWRFEIEEYLDAANSIVVIGFYAGVHLSKKSFRSNTAHVYDLADGKVTRFRHTDTKLIWDTMS
ncbi:nuclear transport factor 2 family protein [Rivularia sp. UHCC 0363]|uniref:nuclear transport factor 2 family protein n=1 Tax=Rivularia sp. UHCC 0363 TaxID=3110244 RepID=UPI002B2019B9|nr:nuclear transport factor 2 family protein [Rivularia sp. UHCC 0363]MEA5595193.1 nuclear transport factor 2 family protein [Rivularia sp. UHCC 0363]